MKTQIAVEWKCKEIHNISFDFSTFTTENYVKKKYFVVVVL